MKRTLLLSVLLACTLSLAIGDTSSTNNYTLALDTAKYMEDHYGITILIGDECNGIDTAGFEISGQPSGRTPFLHLLSYTDYEEEIRRIDECLSAYPCDFFVRFNCSEAENGLRILVPNRIIAQGMTMAGVTTIQDGYYNIFLGAGAFNSLNVHHEIWHAMEYRITLDEPDAFADWNELNPDGFVYNENYLLNDAWAYPQYRDDYFVRGYSMVNEMEDRATVAEAIFQYDSVWWKEHPLIQRKRDVLLRAVQLVFGNVYHLEELGDAF